MFLAVTASLVGGIGIGLLILFSIGDLPWLHSGHGVSVMTLTTQTVPNLVGKAEPAVVQINAVISSKRTRQTGAVLGSGFLINAKGYIITNDHVIHAAKHIRVSIGGHSHLYKATVVGADYNLDLALLKVSSKKPLPFLTFAHTKNIQVGEPVVAIGNPYGLTETVTMGVISGEGRPMLIGHRQYRNLLQTDAAINPGNSGGPLLNLFGRVVGVDTAVNVRGQNLGFAITSATVKKALPYLYKGQSAPEPWLGVNVTRPTALIIKQKSLPNRLGALVIGLVSGSPAQKAGIRKNDLIVSLNHQAITGPNRLVQVVASLNVGQKVVIGVLRQNKLLHLNVTIGKLPSH